MSIALTLSYVVPCTHARTGGQPMMSGKLFGYARVSVASDADANTLENQRRILAELRGRSWRPWEAGPLGTGRG